MPVRGAFGYLMGKKKHLSIPYDGKGKGNSGKMGVFRVGRSRGYPDFGR